VATSGLNTGIQRVVRNVLLFAPELAAEIGFEFRPVMHNGFSFSEVRLAESHSEGLDAVRSYGKEVLDATAQLVRALVGRATHASSAAAPGSAPRTLPLQKRLRHFARRLLYYAFTRRRRYRRLLDFREGDVLLMLDSSWQGEVWDSVARAKQRGACIGVVVYDLVRELEQILERHAKDGEAASPTRPGPLHAVTWRESSKELLRKVLLLSLGPAHTRP
jgi:hypothetical protein